MSREKDIDALVQLLPSELDVLILKLEAPVVHLPGNQTAQGSRVAALGAWLDADNSRWDRARSFLLPSEQRSGLDSPFNRLLEVDRGQRFRVWDAVGQLHEFAWDLPELPAGPHVANAKYWKRVHTLTERAYWAYREVRVHQIRCKADRDSDAHRHSTQACIDTAKPQIVGFSEDVSRLPAPVSSTPPIMHLRRLPVCSDAIKQSAGCPSATPAFEHGMWLVEQIEAWLLDMLHIADIILEDHFNGD